LSLKDFLQLFRKDEISERLTDKIRELTLQQLQKKQNPNLKKAVPVPSVSIANLQDYVKSVWYQIANGKEPLELPLLEVARLITKEWQIMTEINSCVSYINKATGCDRPTIDWDEFRKLFAKGILKYCILNAARQLQSDSPSEKSIMAKMNE
jgi:hypothetical protein